MDVFSPVRRSWWLAMLLVAACGGGAITGGDDDDDDVTDGGVGDGGGDDQPDGGGAPCVATGPEVFGDGLDNDCDGVIDEPSVCADGSQPFTTIAAAIAAAPDGSTIEVCAGTYAERLAISDRSIGLHGAGVGATILDAGDAGTAITVTGGHTLTLDGFTIRGGRTTGTGGGIYCATSAVTMRASSILASRGDAGGGGLYGLHCAIDIQTTRFEGNEGGVFGGAAYLVESTGTITDSQLVGNSADEGGALYLRDGDVDVDIGTFTSNHARVRGGAIYQNSDSAIDNSVINLNTSGWTAGGIYVWQHAPTFHQDIITANDAEWEGGGLYLHQSHTVITDSQITYNTSFDDGGGLRIFESPVRLERNLLANNHAVDGDGGAFKSSHVAGLYIDNEIRDNQALGAGGGVELDNDSSVVRGGVISGNRASIGGGIHAMLWPWNDGLIEGVRVEGNHAWRGGGMYLQENFQLVTIRDVVVVNNTAHQGAGIYTRGTPLRLSNTLIVGNAASDVGGAFYADPSGSYPWDDECPCPPLDPAAEIAFVVGYGNTADAGAVAWIGAPNLTFHSSIFTGHTGTAVVVAEPVPPTLPTDPPAVSAVPAWRYNDTYPATFEGMSPSGSGNLSIDPAFSAAASGDFHLTAGSACVDAGDPAIADGDGSRADMGIYAGPHAMP